ncbi:MAG: CHAT domain-containing protein [candidate division Zixibacteria bacterium]|nr:CHAT domain-containing protein [candidate division Zixibacteria bacterium]
MKLSGNLIILLISVLILASQSHGENTARTEDVARNEIGKLITQSGSLRRAENFDSAIVVANYALHRAKAEFGKPDTLVVDALEELASIYGKRRQWSDAEKYHVEAIEILRDIYGPTHIEIAACLEHIAYAYGYQSKHAKEVAAREEALRIKEEILGPNDPTLSDLLGIMGDMYRYLCRYDEAEAACVRNLNMREEHFGTDAEKTASAYKLLGSLYLNQARLAEAELYLMKAKRIFENGDEELGNMASVYNFLGNLYLLQGKPQKAELHYERSLKLREEISESIRLGESYNNLGYVYRLLGKHKKAERYLKMATENREIWYGPDHPFLVYSLGNLGEVYSDQGRYKEAESLYFRVFKLAKSAYGMNHILTTTGLNGLGRIYLAQGEYSKAEKYYAQSLDIYQNLFGAHHPDVINSLKHLALVYGSQERDEKCLKLFEEIRAARQHFINDIFSYASEAQKLTYINKYPLIDDPLLSFALNSNSYKARKIALEMLFDGKGVVLEAVSVEKEITYCSLDDDILRMQEELNKIGGKIANLVLSGGGKLSSEGYRDSLKVWSEYRNNLEREISFSCSDFADAAILKRIALEDITEALQDGSVLWEIIKFNPYDFNGIGDVKDRSAPTRYMLLQLSYTGDIHIVDLGQARIIDSLIIEYQREIANAGETIYVGKEELAEQKLRGITSQLHELVFAPLVEHLEGIYHIYISPDGELNLLPYYILPLPNGKYVIEGYEISYLTSGRDLVKYKQQEDLNNNKAVVIADPDFDRQPNQESAEIASLKSKIEVYGESMGTRSVIVNEECLFNPFSPLSGTRDEAAAITELLIGEAGFQPESYWGAKASEAVLKTLEESPRIVHLATHGFFCPKSSFTGKSSFHENPLLYSGLALSGANNLFVDNDENDSRIHQLEDGLLTSLEVSGLSLMDTELVVLSACRSGMGEIKNGEGVFGLRRSFQHAGTKSILMSMWDVPDKETRELMISYYRYWLSGESKSAALRISAIELLEKRREEYGCGHPLFWGGFMLVGDSN